MRRRRGRPAPAPAPAGAGRARGAGQRGQDAWQRGRDPGTRRQRGPRWVEGACDPESGALTLVPLVVDKRESGLMGVRRTGGTDFRGLPRLWTGPQDPEPALRKKVPPGHFRA